MAVLEAFVYDPLINWKLQLQPSPPAQNDMIEPGQQNMGNVHDAIGMISVDEVDILEDRPRGRVVTNENELIQRENTQPDAINELALQVLNRVQDKLTGTMPD